jgi:hypothetical protein
MFIETSKRLLFPVSIINSCLSVSSINPPDLGFACSTILRQFRLCWSDVWHLDGMTYVAEVYMKEMTTYVELSSGGAIIGWWYLCAVPVPTDGPMSGRLSNCPRAEQLFVDDTYARYQLWWAYERIVLGRSNYYFGAPPRECTWYFPDAL